MEDVENRKAGVGSLVDVGSPVNTNGEGSAKSGSLTPKAAPKVPSAVQLGCIRGLLNGSTPNFDNWGCQMQECGSIAASPTSIPGRCEAGALELATEGGWMMAPKRNAGAGTAAATLAALVAGCGARTALAEVTAAPVAGALTPKLKVGVPKPKWTPELPNGGGADALAVAAAGTGPNNGVDVGQTEGGELLVLLSCHTNDAQRQLAKVSGGVQSRLCFSQATTRDRA